MKRTSVSVPVNSLVVSEIMKHYIGAKIRPRNHLFSPNKKLPIVTRYKRL